MLMREDRAVLLNAEPRGFSGLWRKTAAIQIGKHVRPARQFRIRAICDLGVHRAEHLADDFVRVRRIPLAHLIGRRGEQARAVEDVGIFREKAENQPLHKLVHVRSARRLHPFGIVLQQLDIKLVKPPRRPNVERAFADLLDGGDARHRQEKTEMIGEVGIEAGDGRIVAGEILRLERLAVSGEDELGFGRGCFRAVALGFQGCVNRAHRAYRQEYIVAL